MTPFTREEATALHSALNEWSGIDAPPVLVVK